MLSKKEKLLTKQVEPLRSWSVSAATPWLLAKTGLCVWTRTCTLSVHVYALVIYFNGGFLDCEAVRWEAPAELFSTGAHHTTMSWGPTLMAWRTLTAVVPSRLTAHAHEHPQASSFPPFKPPYSFSTTPSASHHMLGALNSGTEGLRGSLQTMKSGDMFYCVWHKSTSIEFLLINIILQQVFLCPKKW